MQTALEMTNARVGHDQQTLRRLRTTTGKLQARLRRDVALKFPRVLVPCGPRRRYSIHPPGANLRYEEENLLTVWSAVRKDYFNVLQEAQAMMEDLKDNLTVQKEISPSRFLEGLEEGEEIFWEEMHWIAKQTRSRVTVFHQPGAIPWVINNSGILEVFMGISKKGLFPLTTAEGNIRRAGGETNGWHEEGFNQAQVLSSGGSCTKAQVRKEEQGRDSYRKRKEEIEGMNSLKDFLTGTTLWEEYVEMNA